MNVLNDAEWMMEDCKGDYSLAARLWRRSRHYCSTKDTYVRQVPTNASSLRTTCTVRKRMYRYIEKEEVCKVRPPPATSFPFFSLSEETLPFPRM